MRKLCFAAPYPESGTLKVAGESYDGFLLQFEDGWVFHPSLRRPDHLVGRSDSYTIAFQPFRLRNGILPAVRTGRAEIKPFHGFYQFEGSRELII